MLIETIFVDGHEIKHSDVGKLIKKFIEDSVSTIKH